MHNQEHSIWPHCLVGRLHICTFQWSWEGSLFNQSAPFVRGKTGNKFQIAGVLINPAFPTNSGHNTGYKRITCKEKKKKYVFWQAERFATKESGVTQIRIPNVSSLPCLTLFFFGTSMRWQLLCRCKVHIAMLVPAVSELHTRLTSMCLPWLFHKAVWKSFLIEAAFSCYWQRRTDQPDMRWHNSLNNSALL